MEAKKASRRHGAASPKLTKERILAAGLALLVERGVDAFSLRELAKSLGVFPTSIYWHIANKRELLSAIVGYALNEVDPPDHILAWDLWLQELFMRYRNAVVAHPAVAPLIISSLVPNAGVGLDIIEKIMNALTVAGFEGRRLVAAYNSVIAAMVSFVVCELAELPNSDEEWVEAMKERTHTINVAKHPTLAKNIHLLANRAFLFRWENGIHLSGSFEFWVTTFVTGLRGNLIEPKAHTEEKAVSK